MVCFLNPVLRFGVSIGTAGFVLIHSVDAVQRTAYTYFLLTLDRRNNTYGALPILCLEIMYSISDRTANVEILRSAIILKPSLDGWTAQAGNPDDTRKREPR